MKLRLLTILCILLAFVACREDHISDDPSLRITFSKDTISFDTVFTDIGSATLRVMVYNKNANALRINKVWLDDGLYFKVNVDGESDLSRAAGLEIRGGDSLFVFIKVNINPLNQNTPVLISDRLHFSVNGKTQSVVLEAVGQDVHLIKSVRRLTRKDQYTFESDKPYLIYDTLIIKDKLVLNTGAHLYFHNGAVLINYGSATSKGTLDKPVILQGDRIDQLFDSVPYSYVAGTWGGVYLLDEKAASAKTYTFDYTEILSANVGLYCYSEKTENLPLLQLTNSRIHNHAVYGLVAQDMNVQAVNCEISNAAAYCVYLSGGKHRFIHSTIAAYFNSTNVRIQNTPREDVAAVYINNLSKSIAHTDASFVNCIVTGIRSNNLVVATPLPHYYTSEIANNYIKADSLTIAAAHNNVYWQKTDTMPVFRNTYYKYKEYVYYDFRLDSLSPARGIADSATAASYPTDRFGHPRVASNADAGCYQYEPY